LKRSTDEWLSKEAYFPPVEELELQHYYRAMDFLLDTDQELERALYEHYRQLSGMTTDMWMMKLDTGDLDDERGGGSDYGMSKNSV
jgi:hypothetical protein